MRWTSRIERTVSAAHHNGPVGSRCHNNHGHDWHIVVEFSYTKLNDYGWGPDFGQIKDALDTYDHIDLNNVLEVPSAENFAHLLFTDLHDLTGIAPDFVSVTEGHDNKVTYQ